MAVLIETVREKAAGGTRDVKVSFANCLDPSDTIASIVVAEVTTSALTISGAAVNSERIVVEDKPVRIGAAALFRVAGGTADTTYKIRITATTTAGEIIIKVVQLLVRSDDGT